MSRVAVIGGGAAGMMAAVIAAERGHAVDLYEKNEKLGKKLFITGKGRCNLTNNCETEELLNAVCENRKFLYSAFYGFDSQSTMRFFEECGLKLKTERGGRVFPESDHSSDVIAALTRRLKRTGVRIHLNEEVRELRVITTSGKAGEHRVTTLPEKAEKRRSAEVSAEAETCPRTTVMPAKAKEHNMDENTPADLSAKFSCVKELLLASGRCVEADAVIVATGGLSYPSTGSTGDGYRFARENGLQVTELSPSLVPIETEGDWAQRMQGLSLRNVGVMIRDGKKELYRGFGEMMFTHFGVTGPLILTASCKIQKQLRAHPLSMEIDLKPALTEEQLDARILREFEAAKNREFKNVLPALFPSKMVSVMAELSEIPGQRPIHDITREERGKLIAVTKRFPLTLLRLRDYNEAIITRGGVSVREINPATMESKKIRGLHFAGEVLDVDAVTGGYNLQIAWATGYAAGDSV